MKTIIFHKNLVPLTGIKQVSVKADTLVDIQLFLEAFYPKFFSHFKVNNHVRYTFLQEDGTTIPKNWIYQNKIPHEVCTLKIVPVISGGYPGVFEAISTSLAQFSLSDFLLKTAFSLAVNFALSAVIQTLLPQPTKRTDPTRENDIFGSIVNTADSGISIPLNYGMLRVGGQYLSSELETATDQRLPDPEVSESNLLDYSGSSGGNSEGYGSFGLDRDFTGIAGQLGDAPTPTGTSGLTPDQY